MVYHCFQEVAPRSNHSLFSSSFSFCLYTGMQGTKAAASPTPLPRLQLQWVQR